MTTRRVFLQGALTTMGVALAGTSLSSSAAGLVGPGRNDAQRLYTVVYEPTDPASAQFGALSRHLGHTTHAIDGDVTGLWTRHLAVQWRKEPIAIAGMTHAGALFVLERFAWDHGLRVVFRAEHRPQSDGNVAHVLTGPSSMLSACEALAAQKISYASCMAGVVGQRPERITPLVTKSLLTPSVGDSPATRTMYTWVIAPRQTTGSGRAGGYINNGIIV